MPESQNTFSLFSLFSLFFFSLSTGSSEPLPYQTLNPKPLSSEPQAHHTTQHLPWSQTLTDPQLFSDSQTNPTTSLYIRLEHRDSITLNFTPEHLFTLRLNRDSIRAQTLTAQTKPTKPTRPTGPAIIANRSSSFASSIISGLTQGSGEYFTRLGIGTPPRHLYMVLDTGSDIIWLQCSPCKNCYNQSDPVFNPAGSKSFATVPCNDPLCHRVDASGCSRRRSCLYQVLYGDGSFTVGDFSTETLTFRRASIGKVALGCGHDNEGLFVGAAGLLGLGRGGLSFPSQMGQRIGRKFSYCLVDRESPANSTSSMIFGESAIPRSAVFTPMIRNPNADTFYYVELVGISVGGSRVSGIDASDFRLDPAGNGGVIVDSGTSVTRLVQSAYVALRDAFRTASRELPRASDFSLFDTCYNLTGRKTVKVPTVILHFSRGADVALPATNYLIPVDGKGTFCFAFAGSSSEISIIGNIQQQGFRVVFDSAGGRVGFAPHGCT